MRGSCRAGGQGSRHYIRIIDEQRLDDAMKHRKCDLTLRFEELTKTCGNLCQLSAGYNTGRMATPTL